VHIFLNFLKAALCAANSIVRIAHDGIEQAAASSGYSSFREDSSTTAPSTIAKSFPLVMRDWARGGPFEKARKHRIEVGTPAEPPS
jgi:hypothetical protein